MTQRLCLFIHYKRLLQNGEYNANYRSGAVRAYKPLLECGQLFNGGSDLFTGQPSFKGAAAARTYQAAFAGALGNVARSQLHLRASEQADTGSRCEHDLPGRPRTRRTRAAGKCLSGGDIFGNLSEGFAG